MKRYAALLLLCTGLARPAGAVEGVASATVFFLPGAGGQAGTAYIELCWQIDPMSLHYRKDTAGMLTATVRTDIVIRNDTGIVAGDHYLLHTRPAYPQAASAQHILELRRLTVPAGSMQLTLKLTEPQFPQRNFSYTQNISVPQPDSVGYSGIQLVDTAYPAVGGEDPVFFRNGHTQLPWPGNFLDDNRKVIRYYAELYGADRLHVETYPVVQHVSISRREDGGMIQHLQRTDTLLPAPVVPVSGQFDLSALASGNYYLGIRLLDRDRHPLATRSFFFQLVNKHPAAIVRDTTADTTEGTTTFLDMSTTFVAKYTLPQVRAILEMLLPVSDDWDRKAIENFMKKPDEMYMRYFIYNYFLKINGKDPEQAWKAFSDRVREVNRMFGSGVMPGYKTDRGIIYLKYGKPNDRIVVNNEPGALPYEIWQYYALGRQSMEGVFLFYQPGSSVHDYRLLHSTVNGEMRNSQWRRSLYIKGEDNGNANSRAEQYIRNR